MVMCPAALARRSAASEASCGTSSWHSVTCRGAAATTTAAACSDLPARNSTGFVTWHKVPAVATHTRAVHRAVRGGAAREGVPCYLGALEQRGGGGHVRRRHLQSQQRHAAQVVQVKCCKRAARSCASAGAKPQGITDAAAGESGHRRRLLYIQEAMAATLPTWPLAPATMTMVLAPVEVATHICATPVGTPSSARVTCAQALTPT
jgi:hypothetical protein